MNARRLTAGLAGTAAAVAVLAPPSDALARRTGGPTVAAAALTVSTSLAPNPAFFGDPVVALITVVFDARTLEASSVQVNPSFEPYAATGLPQVTSSKSGSVVRTQYRYTIQCLSASCLPGTTSARVRLPPVVVSATATAGGRRVRGTARWTPLAVASRVSKSELARSTLPLRSPSTMPPADYAVSPGALAGGLTALAALLALGALALLGFELLRLRANVRSRSLRALSPLERALAYTREAAGRSEATDRRKAIGLLATTLEAEGHHALADSSEAVAWSEAPPTPASALALADEVEASLEPEQSRE